MGDEQKASVAYHGNGSAPGFEPEQPGAAREELVAHFESLLGGDVLSPVEKQNLAGEILAIIYSEK